MGQEREKKCITLQSYYVPTDSLAMTKSGGELMPLVFAPQRRAARFLGCLASVWAISLTLNTPTAYTQISAVGATNAVKSFFVRGVDAAYNPASGGYLVVGAAGPVIGVCVGGGGGAAAAAITVKSNASGIYASFPRATYSPALAGGAGGFMVVWPEEQTNHAVILKSRIVTCAGVVGTEHTIDNGNTAFGESGPDIAYSATSQKFLVVWRTAANARVVTRLVDLTGAGVGAVITLSSGFGRDPGVAWNPATNDFGVSFSGETSTGVYSAFVRVPASNPAAFARTTFNSYSGGMTTITDIDYNPVTNRYIMAWYDMRSTLNAMVAEFDASGHLLTKGIASSHMGSYDALSLAYNPVSGTFLLAGVNPNTDDVLAAELNRHGYRFTSEVKVNTIASNHYTRVASSLGQRRWSATASAHSYAVMSDQIVQTTSTGGGPAGAYGSTTGSTTGSTGGTSSGSTSSCPGAPPGTGWVCVSGSWYPPDYFSGGGTTSCPGTSPGTGWTCVNGNWKPPTTTTCPGTSPGTGWTCVNGNWTPPTTTTCPGTSPGTGWICKSGSWYPPDYFSGSTSTTTCPGTSPGTGWTCVNGNWFPPSSGDTSSCPGSPPGTGWICKSGSWYPPDYFK